MDLRIIPRLKSKLPVTKVPKASLENRIELTKAEFERRIIGAKKLKEIGGRKRLLGIGTAAGIVKEYSVYELDETLLRHEQWRPKARTIRTENLEKKKKKKKEGRTEEKEETNLCVLIINSNIPEGFCENKISLLLIL